MQTGHEFIPHETGGMYKHSCLIYCPGSKEITANISRLCNSNQSRIKFQAELYLSSYQRFCRKLRERDPAGLGPSAQVRKWVVSNSEHTECTRKVPNE